MANAVQGSDHVHLQPWSLSESPSSSLNPKTQKWMRKRWKEAWSSNWTSSAPQEGCGCTPAVSQGPGGHPNCTTPALVQLPRSSLQPQKSLPAPIPGSRSNSSGMGGEGSAGSSKGGAWEAAEEEMNWGHRGCLQRKPESTYT